MQVTRLRARALLLVMVGGIQLATFVAPRADAPGYERLVSLEVRKADTDAEILAERILPQFSDMLRELTAIEHSRSVTRNGHITMSLYLSREADAASVAAQVRERAYRVQERIGGRLERPVVSIARSDSSYSFLVAVSADMNRVPDRHHVEHDLVPRLRRIPGVAAVDVYGGTREEIRVEVPSAFLATHAMSVRDLQAGLRHAEIIAPVGRVRSGDQDMPVVYDSRAVHERDLATHTLLQSSAPETALLPTDSVQTVPGRQDRIVRLNGRQHIAVGVRADASASLPGLTRAARSLVDEWTHSQSLTAEVVLDEGAEARRWLIRRRTIAIAMLLGYLCMFRLSGSSTTDTLHIGVGLLVAAGIMSAICSLDSSFCGQTDVLPSVVAGLLLASLCIHSCTNRVELAAAGVLLVLLLTFRDPLALESLRVQLFAFPTLRLTRFLSRTAFPGRPEPQVRIGRCLPIIAGSVVLPLAVTAAVVVGGHEPTSEQLHLDIDAYAPVAEVDRTLLAASDFMEQRLFPVFVQTLASPGSGTMLLQLRAGTDREELMSAIEAFNRGSGRGQLLPLSPELPGKVFRVAMYASADTASDARRLARRTAQQFGNAVLHFREDVERLVLRPRRSIMHARGVDVQDAVLLVQSIISPGVHHKRIDSGRELDVRVAVEPASRDPQTGLESLLRGVQTGADTHLYEVFTLTRESRPQTLTHSDRRPSAHFSVHIQAPSARAARRAARDAVLSLRLEAAEQLHVDTRAAREQSLVELVLRVYIVLLTLVSVCAFLRAGARSAASCGSTLPVFRLRPHRTRKSGYRQP